jgi:hypothetical protein
MVKFKVKKNTFDPEKTAAEFDHYVIMIVLELCVLIDTFDSKNFL